MYKLLIIDDDEIDRESIKRELGEDFNISEATSGREAIEKISKDETFELIILDYLLPDTNGIELIENIKAITKAPVVAMTGQGSEEKVVAFLKKGAVDYLVKNKLDKNLALTLLPHIEQYRIKKVLFDSVEAINDTLKKLSKNT
jgi:CheY-like chemotaxis protein